MGVTKIGDFEFIEQSKIGQGSFSTVYKGKHSSKPTDNVAVKLVQTTGAQGICASLEHKMKTLRDLKTLSHPNLVSIHDCKALGMNIFIIMEYCNGGNLARYLRSHHQLSESTTHLFLRQLAKGLAALHAMCIVHRDLKPQNVMLSYSSKLSHTPQPSEISLKITDYGVPSLLASATNSSIGTPSYMAPEVTMSQKYDSKSDLFSLGTIAYECLTGESPLHKTSSKMITTLCEKNEDLPLKIPSNISHDLRFLLFAILRLNPRKRITFEEFNKHPYLHPYLLPYHHSSVPSQSHHGSGGSGHASTTSHWVTVSDGHVPSGAVVGGHDCSGDVQYVVRAKHEGDTVPGKFVPSHKSAYVPWGGKEHSKTECQILVGGSQKWVPTHGSKVPSGALPAGKTEKGETLYVGRVHHKGSVITGKVQPSHGVCFIALNGTEVAFPDYDILMQHA